ncbi:MAG: hypothetical protein ACRDZV_10500, partial [Acidimicrobiia bacterium]
MHELYPTPPRSHTHPLTLEHTFDTLAHTMGYRGKVREQEQARVLRAQGKTLAEIADELDVSKSSVSLWVRDVPFTPSKRRRGPQRRRHPARERKLQEIEELNRAGNERVSRLSSREFLLIGAMLYAGEGFKTDQTVGMANTDPQVLAFFLAWLRHFFAVDESRLRMRMYLHEGLDLEAAEAFWSGLTGIPREQFGKPYRAKADPSIRRSKHPYGCPSIS